MGPREPTRSRDEFGSDVAGLILGSSGQCDASALDHFLLYRFQICILNRIGSEKFPVHSFTEQFRLTILRQVSKKSALYSSSARAISTSFSFRASGARSLRTSPTGR